MNILDNYLDTMFSRYPLTPRTQEAKRELRAMMEDAYNGALAAGHSRNEAIGQAISEFGNLEEIAPALGLVDTEPAFARSRDFHESTGFHENTALRENTDLNESAGAPEDSDAPSAAAPNVSYAARQTAPHGRAGASAHGKAPASAYPVPEKRSITMAQARNYIAAMKRSRWLLGIGVALMILFGVTLVSESILNICTMLTAVKIIRHQMPDAIETEEYEVNHVCGGRNGDRPESED